MRAPLRLAAGPGRNGRLLASAVMALLLPGLATRVQAAVKRAIMGLIVLDAVLATALAGTVGLVILLLLVPALYLGRWIYST